MPTQSLKKNAVMYATVATVEYCQAVVATVAYTDLFCAIKKRTTLQINHLTTNHLKKHYPKIFYGKTSNNQKTIS